MKIVDDISRQRFGRLTAIMPVLERLGGRPAWLFRCDCGNDVVKQKKLVKSGNTKSCGCLPRHGKSTKVAKACPVCGAEFKVKKSYASKSKYCSYKCMADAYKTRLVGDDNPNYRGGRSGTPERIREYASAWRQANPGKVKARNRATKAKRKGSMGSVSDRDISRMRRRQDGLCVICKCDLMDGEHLDHIIPVSRGGSSYVGNMQLLCVRCNLRKSAMLPIEYRVRNS